MQTLLLISFFVLLSATSSAQNARILGRVLGETNEPLSAVTIYVVNGNHAQASLTNASGYYTFLSVPPGTYTLKAVKRGMLLQEKTVAVAMNTTMRLDLKVRQNEPMLATNENPTLKSAARAKQKTMTAPKQNEKQTKQEENKTDLSEPEESEENSPKALSEEEVNKDEDLKKAVETAKSAEASDALKVDTKPEVIGGIETINRKIIYPEALRAKGLQGGVIAKVSVDATGNPTKVLILKSSDPMFSEEVFRVLSEDIKFKPATLNGKPVASAAVIYVEFKLN